ncbi:MAG: hypothetical protein NTX88_09565, partial [Candidatus Atribacteria bacterium]|nr:hypothetical protein [Candidatus Atribacteria bacterium]
CFREWDQLHKEIDAATQHLTGVQKRCENAQKSMECAHWELVQYQKTWQDWLTNHSFPTTFRPDGFETILQVVENARAIEQSLNDMEAEMEQTESYIRMIRMKISEILKKCAVPQLPVEPGVRDLEILQFLVEEAIEKKRKCDDLTNQLAVLRIEKGSLENRTIAKNDEISALFDQAGAGNEEEFRRIAMTFEEWCQCQKIIVENEQSLLVITGSLEKINDYEGELQHTDILEVQKEKEKLENELRSLQERLKTDNLEWGATNQRMSTLASDQRLGMLLLEERTLEEKIKESTKHWASLAVCRFFLDKTREKYEHERQPRVIQEANRFLQLMTGERYRLVSSLEENEIQLEDNTLRRKVETTWSSGLADQVYLAIRLGLAREFGRMSEPLPIVLDDILVKFDPIRQTSTCRVLLDLAREQQIILFSCHPETREIIFDTLQSGAYDDVPVTAYQVEDGHVTPGR